MQYYFNAIRMSDYYRYINLCNLRSKITILYYVILIDQLLKGARSKTIAILINKNLLLYILSRFQVALSNILFPL